MGLWKQNENEILFGKNKISFDETKFCFIKTKFRFIKRNFVSNKILFSNKISFWRNKISFLKTKFCFQNEILFNFVSKSWRTQESLHLCFKKAVKKKQYFLKRNFVFKTKFRFWKQNFVWLNEISFNFVSKA